MTDQQPSKHKLSMEQPGAVYFRIACSCGASSGAEISNRSGSNKLTKWVMQHREQFGELDESDLS